MADVTNADTVDNGHNLLCPTCRVDLVMSERQGIEIDYCPKCRGVWLDRGELDKIIERSPGEGTRSSSASAPESQRDNGRGAKHGGHGDRGSGNKHGSFFGRLFH